MEIAVKLRARCGAPRKRGKEEGKEIQEKERT